MPWNLGKLGLKPSELAFLGDTHCRQVWKLTGGWIDDPIRARKFSRTQDPVECGYRIFFGTTARFGLTPLVHSPIPLILDEVIEMAYGRRP